MKEDTLYYDIGKIATDTGKVLAQWRQENGLTLYALAKLTNQRQEVLRRIEHGGGSMASLLAYLHAIKALDADTESLHLFTKLYELLS